MSSAHAYEKKRILFVCHGNICRSPMAESIFKKMLEEEKLENRYVVESAAVSDEERGNSVYPAANAELMRHGLPKSEHRAWQITDKDYDQYDFFVGMDVDNVQRMRMIFCGDPKHKIGLLLGYTSHPREVEDPWMTGRFEHVFNEIEEGCGAFLKALLEDEKA